MKLLIIKKDNVVDVIGGAEKVLADLANEMSVRGMIVTVATNDMKTGKPAFGLKDGISFKNICCRQQRKSKRLNKPANVFGKIVYEIFRPLIKVYNEKICNYYLNRRICEKELRSVFPLWQKLISEVKPDLIICFGIDTYAEIMGKNKSEIPVIVSNHTRPDIDYDSVYTWKPDYERAINKEICNNVDVMHVLCPSYRALLQNWYYGKIVSIPNVVKKIPCQKKVSTKSIVTMARIDFASKGQDRLVRAFALLADKYSEWTLHIYGDGKDMKALKKLIDGYNLSGRILLPGYIKDSLSVLKQADIFAFPSKFEGFPLALTEAMSCGLPSVGLVTCSGTNELIKDGENGFLTEDSDEAFAAGLEKLMVSEKLREKCGEQAYRDIDQYAPAKVWPQWEDLIKECVQANKNS